VPGTLAACGGRPDGPPLPASRGGTVTWPPESTIVRPVGSGNEPCRNHAGDPSTAGPSVAVRDCARAPAPLRSTPIAMAAPAAQRSCFMFILPGRHECRTVDHAYQASARLRLRSRSMWLRLAASRVQEDDAAGPGVTTRGIGFRAAASPAQSRLSPVTADRTLAAADSSGSAGRSSSLLAALPNEPER